MPRQTDAIDSGDTLVIDAPAADLPAIRSQLGT
jgi:hypothetical protein